MKRTGPTNSVTKKLIEDLSSQGHKNKSKFMLSLAEQIGAPTRKRAEVNLSKLQRVCKENDTIVVPGKVLSFGILTKPVTVSALCFSKQAVEKIKKAGGKAMTIQELIDNNPSGKNVRMIK